jgi:hypothetical protein
MDLHLGRTRKKKLKIIWANEKMITHIQYYENLLGENLLKLEESKKISVNALITFLTKFKLLDDNSLELLQVGISRHFSHDYISSIHILIPQLENIIRLILKELKINILKEENDAIMNKQIRGLLEMPEVSQILGTNFCNYLIIKYADIKSINLRNDVSHGLLKVNDFNHSNSCGIIYGLVKLLKNYGNSRST